MSPCSPSGHVYNLQTSLSDIPSAILLIASEKAKCNTGKMLHLYHIPVEKKSHFNNDSLSLKFFKIKSEYISFLLVLREMLFLQIFLLVILIYTLTLSSLCAVVHLVKKTSNMVLPTLLFWCWEYLKDLNLVVSKKEICNADDWQSELSIYLFQPSDSQWDYSDEKMWKVVLPIPSILNNPHSFSACTYTHIHTSPFSVHHYEGWGSSSPLLPLGLSCILQLWWINILLSV